MLGWEGGLRFTGGFGLGRGGIQPSGGNCTSGGRSMLCYSCCFVLFLSIVWLVDIGVLEAE